MYVNSYLLKQKKTFSSHPLNRMPKHNPELLYYCYLLFVICKLLSVISSYLFVVGCHLTPYYANASLLSSQQKLILTSTTRILSEFDCNRKTAIVSALGIHKVKFSSQFTFSEQYSFFVLH